MRKKTIEEIRKFVEKRGYELLSKEYVNAHTKMEFRCIEKHKFKITWSYFQQGIRCPVCAGWKWWKKTIEEIRKFVEKHDFELLSKEYIGTHTKMKFRCPHGHEFEMTWSNFGCGQRCPTCSYINRCGPNGPAWRGGISKDPYCEVWCIKDFKEMIKTRDGYKCMNPCCSIRSSMLDVHHINYNKLDCNRENLITVCRRCNSIANFSREWHQAWYQAIMYMRYGHYYIKS